MTIHQAILYGEAILRDKGIADPRWNSERLLLLTLDEPRSKIYTELGRELEPAELSRFQELLRKRAGHYPLAYLEETQEFFGREFQVTEAVLIPRPETEQIIRAVLALGLKNPWILDLGSGSGVIPITLALEIPGSYTFAVELSAAAIDVLRKNNKGSVCVIRGDFSSLCFLPDTFDLVTANLPYVESDDYQNLPPETAWEPRVALHTRSLEETYSRAIREGIRVLKPEGYMVMEFGYGQADRLKALCVNEPAVKLLEIQKDERKIPRILLLQKPK
jgi:release factor glutamine methyltransferase